MERLHRVVHVTGEVDVLGDGLEHVGLLTRAERVVPRLALHRYVFVGRAKAAVGCERGSVHTDHVGARVGIEIV